MTPMVRIAALTNYLEVARHLGLNPQQPLTRVGLSLPMLEHPEQHVPITQVVSLLEKSASGCETFGLHMAESRHLINEVRLERVLRYMENLRYSLSRIACLPGYGMPSSYRNNFIKCEHGKLKRIIGVTLGFKSMKRAYGTIKGIGVMRALCRGQTSPFSYGNPLGEMSGKQSL